MKMAAGLAAIGAIVVARLAAAKLACLALATSAFLFNLWKFVESKHFTHLVGLGISGAAMYLAAKDRRRLGREGELVRQHGEVIRQNADLAVLVEANRRTIEALRQADEAREAEMAQLAEDMLRSKRFIHSGERHPLRPGVPPVVLDVLVVEDDAYLLRALGRLVRRHVSRVVEAGSAREALGLVRAGARFDVVFLDLLLPDVSGLDVLRAIRRDSPRTDVVVITGIAEDRTIAEARECGAKKVLVKPFEVEELLALLGVAETPEAVP
jgi:CheY-like chemotaxis protein